MYGLVLMAKWIEKSDEEKAIAYQNQIVSEKVTNQALCILVMYATNEMTAQRNETEEPCSIHLA